MEDKGLALKEENRKKRKKTVPTYMKQMWQENAIHVPGGEKLLFQMYLRRLVRCEDRL